MTRSLHPYRKPWPVVDDPPTASPEELILYGMLIVVGAIPVVGALIQQARFEVDATLGLLMVGAGGVGAITYAWRAGRARSAWRCTRTVHAALPDPKPLSPNATAGRGSRSR